MKSIYTYYKERLIELSGKNRSLFAKKISKKFAYDLFNIFGEDASALQDFVDFLWNSNQTTYPLISNDNKDVLALNFGIESRMQKAADELNKYSGQEKSAAYLKFERQKKEESKRLIASHATLFKNLKREIEEFEKESGRYELYVGYPFVQGALTKDSSIKAPLLLFPAIIEVSDEGNMVDITIKRDEPVQLNRVLCFALAQQNKLNIENLETEFRGNIGEHFANVNAVLDYLKTFNIRVGQYTANLPLRDYDAGGEPKPKDPLEIFNYCVLGRFPLANSIYNDYTLLEKQKLTNEAIDELLYAKKPETPVINNPDTYIISNLDYAQEKAIQNLNSQGNIVIYGPPGTGKSQTIANIITDALSKNKRVLVVSQKRAALDVVYNRLGSVNERVMFLIDAEKNKSAFYERVLNAHQNALAFKSNDVREKYNITQEKLNYEIQELDSINKTLFAKRDFGLSLQQMYTMSEIIGKSGFEYTIYKNMLDTPSILKFDYPLLSDTLREIKEKGKDELYYRFVEYKKTNPYADLVKTDIDFHTLASARNKLEKMADTKMPPFNFTKYPNSRQLISYYVDKNLDIEKLSPLVKFIAQDTHPEAYQKLKSAKALLVTLPKAKAVCEQIENEVRMNFERTILAIDEHTKGFEFLRDVLTPSGYATLIDYLLNGNASNIKWLLTALDSYIELRDLNVMLEQLADNEKTLLDFAYRNSDTKAEYMEILQKLISIRIYHEITEIENEHSQDLALLLQYNKLRERILSLKAEQAENCKQICQQSFWQEYVEKFNISSDSKSFLYQISKQQNLWPIRQFMETFDEFMFNLFPCWLLSPEDVSTILPLTKNLFDIILFDEASQVFIENTLPCIFRGKNIVVAGDSKQLRPTATFMKRYFGNDDDELDNSTQEALEVESLLDLAMTRYQSTHLTYHYRSKYAELIDFSNHVFYNNRLEIAPNITKSNLKKPIQRIKVDGQWINRCNQVEAQAVVDVLKKLLNTRKNNESIGIITFNSEQESIIEDLIDEECEKSQKFRNQILAERNRKDDGQDISLFIKNLENVQGDERDIIIFSIGYARNEYGKVVAHFGPLSTEGGENRLNVAITRAKQKIFVVTSIEPEELNVENTKNLGPKIFKYYLQYVRAVSAGNDFEAKIILDKITPPTINTTKEPVTNVLEQQVKEALEKEGFKVDTEIGNADYKISLGIYDKKSDRYLLGLETDYTAYHSSPSPMERDVYRPTFLRSRGWTIMRLWSRDWWMNKQKIISHIKRLAEANLQKINESAPQKRGRKITIKKTEEE